MSSVARIGVELTTAKPVKELKKLENALKKVQGVSQNATGSLGELGKGAGAAAAVGKSAKAAVPGVTALGGALKAALGPIAVLTTAAGALTSAFSTLAAQDFAEAKVRSLGVNSDELTKRLSDVSRELAGQADVVELTSAAYDVASAGFTDAADAANILKAASQGATGGFSDINTVGDAATSVLNAYGLQADKAGKLVDGFIQTQNDGKIVIGEYAANIAKVAPVAAALGVPLEEVNAAVAQITAGGQGAEVTFTALKTAFAQVAAGKVGNEFKKFGVEISASTLKSDGLAGTLEKIKKSGADAGTVIKAFGTEAGPSILALLNDTEKFNRLLENQKNSQGAAARAAFEASDTINGALKRLQTAFTNLFADGSELGVLLKGIFQVAAVTVEVFAAAVKLVLAPIRGLVSGVQKFFEELSPFQENINLAYELEQGFQAVMKGVDFAIAAVQGFFSIIGGGAAAAIGNVLGLAESIRSGVVSIFSDLGETVRTTLNNLYAQIPTPIRFIIDQAAKGFKAVAGFLGKAVEEGVKQITGGVTTLAQVGGFNAETSSGAAASAANAIQETGGALSSGQSGGQTEAEKLLEKRRKASQQRIQDLQDQGALAAALNDEERRQVQLNLDLRDIIENTKGLKDSEVKAEIEARLAFEDKVLAAQKYKKDSAEAAKAQKEAADAIERQAQRMQQIYDQIGSSIADGVVGMLDAAVDKTKSLADAASNVLRSVGNILMKLGVNTLLKATGLGIFENLGGFFADGGRPPVGRPSVVGERGPELFVPRTSGTIIPNHALGGSANVTVNVDASGSSVEGNGNEAAQLGKVLGLAVQQELLKQKRPGGLLAT
jgi:TP901 family phage tail tape measure protein|tara:strand:- start:7480 stop:9990 length:2511 start_codon:yes stop_codon:yes gene_type:complete